MTTTKRSRQGGPGRPSKGPRDVCTTRLPAALAAVMRAEADRLDMSYGEVIANAVAEHFGHPPVAVPKHQDQMKLTA